jgi:hypothetical protein
MKDLIDILQQLGVSKSILVIISILFVFFLVISSVIKVIHWITLKNNQWLLNENLRPYFSPNEVDRATRYYVPTKYQNVSPIADEEPGKSHIASAKNLLLPMFINEVFNNNRTNTKYYLILADAGMGKTTFLINLFLKYTARPIKNLFGSNENQRMRLLPLGSPDIWKDIEKVESKRDTILLLDAFDEDIKAVDNYDKRMKEIIEATKEFKEIVITCRTQFFPSDKEIPDDTGYTTFGGEQENYKFQRVYLSVFDEKDVKKYLRKRFAFYQRAKRKKAFEIVQKSPNLVMRPMLLSYINDLVEANKTFRYSHEIYEVLIKKWIERESKKHGIRKKYGSEEKYQQLLLNFSQTLAVNLYEKREERGGYFITKDDFIKDSNGLQITDIDNYKMTETEVRSKSLLNRDAEGKYKFSHKSILEYFLAKELIKNSKFLNIFDFDGMSTVEMFLDEKIEPIKKLGGVFTSLDIHYNRPISLLNAVILPEIVILEINQLGNFNVQNLSIFANLEELIIFDRQKYKLLYVLYLIWYLGPKFSEFLEPAMLEQIKQIKQKDLVTRLKLTELIERIKLKELQELPELLKLRERLKLPELQKRLEQLQWLEDTEEEEQIDGVYLIEMLVVLEKLFKQNDNDLIKTLQPIEDFLKDMTLLQEKLPNCRMIY